MGRNTCVPLLAYIVAILSLHRSLDVGIAPNPPMTEMTVGSLGMDRHSSDTSGARQDNLEVPKVASKWQGNIERHLVCR